MTQSQDLFDYLLGLGDDGLVLGQRLGEWCGHAPALEIDLSLTNLALDLIGQATHWLELAGTIEGQGRDGDRLAFHRDVLQFRNCLLVEQPNGDFGRTMARQFLFSTHQLGLLEKLCESTDPRLAEIAAKAVKEVAYHAELAADWVVRLGDGTEESRQRMTDGLDWCARFVDELFVVDAAEERLVELGVAPDRRLLRTRFDTAIAKTLAEARLPDLALHRPVLGGRAGRHSEHLGHLLAQMQHLPRAYPDAVW